jgi:hypothetical protein
MVKKTNSAMAEFLQDSIERMIVDLSYRELWLKGEPG